MIRIDRKDMVIIMLSINSKETFVLFRVNNYHEVDLVAVGTKNDAIVAIEADSNEVTIWNGPDSSTVFGEPKKDELGGYSYLVAVNNAHLCKGLFLDIEGHYHKMIESFGSINK